MGEELIIDKDFILLNNSVKAKNEVILELGNIMTNKKLVKPDFVQSVLMREEKYPTGLEIGEVNIATPHTEACYVNSPCIGIAVLKNPVLFHRMDDITKTVEVKIVFLLALSSNHGHMDILKKIMLACRSKDVLDFLVRTDNKDEVQKLLQEKLKGEN